jgi:indolepyruvate ferredoxin oxidoreductase
MLSGTGPDGRPKKRAFGGWIAKVFPMLARFKALRGTPLDVFGYTSERKMERALIREYEADMARVLGAVTESTFDIAKSLAELPLQIKGFGPVKEAHAKAAAARRSELLQAFEAGGAPLKHAAE